MNKNIKTQPIIETWFPKTLYIVNEFHKEDLSKYRQEILKHIANPKNSLRNSSNYVQSTHKVDNNELMNKTVFDFLKKDINFHSQNYLNMLGYKDKDVKIINMWTNLSKKGDYLFPHNHPNSLLSGAFYVSSDCEEDTIKFYDNINSTLMSPPTENMNHMSFETCSHKCTAGKLIIFKSNFLHSCPVLQGEEKIVISFNIGFKI